MARNARRDGFTLIEVLIVVVIMAVLAATIIPQFSSSTKDARENSIKFNLQSLRSQIELYKIHHNGAAPSGTITNIVNQLTQFTDAAGAPVTAADMTHIYGPYVQGTTLPPNPFSGLSAVKLESGMVLGATPTGATGAPGGGWLYRAATGEIWIDHPSYLNY